jgi:hypothetical protein
MSSRPATEIQQKIEDYYARAANKAARRPAAFLTRSLLPARASARRGAGTAPQSGQRQDRRASTARSGGSVTGSTAPGPSRMKPRTASPPRCERDEPARCDHGKLARTQGQGDPRADAGQCDRLYPLSARTARPGIAVQRCLAAGDLAGSRPRLHAPASGLDARQAPVAGLRRTPSAIRSWRTSASATGCSTSSPRAAVPARSCRRSSRALPRPGTSRCARFRPTADPRGISRTTRSRPTSAAGWGSSPRSRQRSCCGTAAKGRAIPIGYGVMSADELQDRIYLLTSKEAGRDY